MTREILNAGKVIVNVCSVPDTHAWRLASELVSWSTKGDKQKVNLLCGGVLGWTNHVAEVAQSVLEHCKEPAKKKLVF